MDVGGDGDLGAMALLREFPREDRDGDAHEIEGVAGGIAGVVPFVDPAQFLEVFDVTVEMVEVDGRFEPDCIKSTAAGGFITDLKSGE